MPCFSADCLFMASKTYCIHFNRLFPLQAKILLSLARLKKYNFNKCVFTTMIPF